MHARVFALVALFAIAAEAATPAKPALARRVSEGPLVLSQRPGVVAKPSLTAGLPGMLGGMDVPLLLYFAFWYLGERAREEENGLEWAHTPP